MARIVVADNDLDALDLALTDLRLEGHEVYGALDAADAEALVGTVSPDVVVLDYRMPPGITGLELAERLVADDPDLRVVIYSNYQKVELRARAAQDRRAVPGQGEPSRPAGGGAAEVSEQQRIENRWVGAGRHPGDRRCWRPSPSSSSPVHQVGPEGRARGSGSGRRRRRPGRRRACAPR